jgi:predicted DCC family thiol-disulfide oxidoreductase YuxK
MPHPILLYDGVCALCNRFVQFVLRRDPGGVFRFASLQSSMAERILQRHGVQVRDLNSVYVVVAHEISGERVLARSDAVIFVLEQLAAAAELRSAGHPGVCPEPVEEPALSLSKGAAVPTAANPSQAVLTGSAPRLKRWRVVARLLELVPRSLRDWGYGVVARHRYRVFGRYDSCPVPAPENRGRFLDL